MTAGKAIALTAAFIGVFALGVAIGPSMTGKMTRNYSTASVESSRPSAEPAPARTQTPRDASKPRARTTTAASKPATPNARSSESVKAASSIPASEPRLYARLKPVLNRGTKMEIASDGFKNAEQFATVAHAARNTDVPFMLLKHRVVTEGKSLEQAIRESKPDLDVKAEVKRAQVDARSDMDALAG